MTTEVEKSVARTIHNLVNIDDTVDVDEGQWRGVVYGSWAQSVVEIGEPAIAPLLALAQTADQRQQMVVFDVLRRMATPEMQDIFIEALNHPNSDVRELAADALAKIGDARAVAPLAAALADPVDHVQSHAAHALGSLGDPQAIGPLIDLLVERSAGSWARAGAADALRDLHAIEAVDALLLTLANESRDLRKASARALGKLGDPRGVEPLLLALHDEEAMVRYEALWALVALDPELALRTFIDALPHEQDSYIATEMIEALGKLEDVRAVEPLIQALDYKGYRVREGAVRSLGYLGDPRAVPLLCRVLSEDRDNMTRQYAAAALKRFAHPETVETLIRALQDRESSVREDAAAALGRIGDARAIEPLAELLRAERGRYSAYKVGDALADFGQRAIPVLMDVLAEDDREIWRFAAYALRKINDAQVREKLIADLGHPNIQIRSESAILLGKLAERNTLGPLIAALHDKAMEVRRAAAWALGESKDKQASDPLVAAMKDRRTAVRQAVVEALGKVGGDEAVQLLIHALDDKNRQVRRLAIESLGQLGDRQALPALEALQEKFATSPSLHRLIWQAVRRIRRL